MTEYPGPWQAGLTHIEIIDMLDGSREYPVGITATTGWQVAGWESFVGTASASKDSAGGISSPPPVDQGLSAEAFTLHYEDPVTWGGSAGAGATLEHTGSLSNYAVGMWRQRDTWTQSGTYWRLGYQTPADVDWRAAAGVPPTEEWPAGVSHYELEAFEWVYDSIKVGGITDIDWSIYVKQPGITTPWFGQMYPDGGATDAIGPSMLELADGAEPIPLNLAEMLAIIEERRSGVPYDVSDQRMPSGALVFDGEMPPLYGPEHGTITYDGPVGSVILTYRAPRWRYVYYEPPPAEIIYRAPRRVFPRDDGLTGGARRTWPPSKGYQWGNRVDDSGYL